MCKTPLTIGVAHRIEQLADRKEPINVPKFYEVIPLTELIAAVYEIKQLNSKKVWDTYNLSINNFQNEYSILLNASFDDLKKVIDEKLAQVIILNRENKLKIKPGYDGVYGEIILSGKEEIKPNNYIKKQKSLSEF